MNSNILEERRKYTFNAFTFLPNVERQESVYIGINHREKSIKYHDFVFRGEKDKNAIIIVSLREGYFITDGKIVEPVEPEDADTIPILISQCMPRVEKTSRWENLDNVLQEAKL